MVSGSVALLCSRFFSPFPHGTGSLSVSREYLALPDGPGRFTQNSSCSALLRIPLCFVSLRIPDCHRLWSVFPGCSSHEISCNSAVLQPHTCRNTYGLGSSPFARHYWGNHCYFLFLQVLRCFSSLRSPSALSGMPSLQDGGLSHSEIRASQVICTYTRLFAAYHVLLRLQEPRHPPYALSFCFYVTHTPRYIRTKWHIYFRLYSVPPLKVGTPSLLLSLVQNVIDLLSLYPRTSQQATAGKGLLWRITDSNR